MRPRTSTGPSTIYTTSRNLPGGERIAIKVRMNDECGNGHADFAVTATVYDKYGKEFMGGCCHEEVLKAAPELKPFVDLHLNDATNGAPMHALANGWYYYELAVGRREDKYKPREYWVGVLRNHLFLEAPEELAAFLNLKLEDQDHFHYAIEESGIPQRWKAKAAAARDLLFSLCKDPAAERAKWAEYGPARITYEPLSDEKRTLLQKRLAEGYYTEAAKEKRAKAKQKAAQAAILADLKADYVKGQKKLANNYKAHVAVVKAGGERFGWIYYDHTNTLRANWSGSGHVSREAYDRVLAVIHKFPLPEGIKIEYGNGN